LSQTPEDPRLAQIRGLSQDYRAGDAGAFTAVRDLFQLLLSATVMANGQAVTLFKSRGSNERTLAGRQLQPVRLTDGRYLRVIVSLFLDDSDRPAKLKVKEASFQYQTSPDFADSVTGEIFRYDYARMPGKNPHPTAHLNIHAALTEPDCLPASKPLARVHFPTARVSLEAVIRCLVEQFDVPTNSKAPVWRALLTESERSFMEIAHQPISGPAV
jgi:hypothetical protein